MPSFLSNIFRRPAPPVVVAPPVAPARPVSNAVPAEVRARVSEYFRREKDQTFDPVRKQFTENIARDSQWMAWAPTVVGDGKLRGELAQMGASRASHYGLRMMDGTQWVRPDHIRLTQVPAADHQGQATVRFDIMDHQDPTKVRASGTMTLEMYRGPGGPDARRIEYNKFVINQGSLDRVPVGFPGVSFASGFVGGEAERLETLAINDEMKRRGLIF